MNRTILLVLSLAIFIVLILLILRFSQASTPSTSFAEAIPLIAGTQTPVRLLFVGDIMLDRSVAIHARQYGDDSLFAGVRSLLSEQDVVIANLEGTITASTSVASFDNLRFTFDPHFAAFLKSIGVTAVSLSNNHTDDFGRTGYEDTKRYLKNAGILSFGSPSNNDELSERLVIKGRSVCLVGYEGFVNADPAPIAAEISRIRPDCDYVVATMHAGVEYEPIESVQQQRAAHAFVDAGADVVIGTHPHVVEPLKVYKGKPIFYSVGNFMFDQDFSFATEHGLAVEIDLDSPGTTFTLIPITIQHAQVSLSDTSSTAQILNALVTSDLPRGIQSSILTQHSFTLP